MTTQGKFIPPHPPLRARWCNRFSHHSCGLVRRGAATLLALLGLHLVARRRRLERSTQSCSTHASSSLTLALTPVLEIPAERVCWRRGCAWACVGVECSDAAVGGWAAPTGMVFVLDENLDVDNIDDLADILTDSVRALPEVCDTTLGQMLMVASPLFVCSWCRRR